jgi:chemotaxis protein CheX
MNNETAIKMASTMMGENFDSFGYLAQSGIAELGNMITGRASMKLSDAGFESTISTPSLIMGHGASISTLDFPRLVVPLNTSAGPFMIHLALRQGTSGLKTPQMAIPRAFEAPEQG